MFEKKYTVLNDFIILSLKKRRSGSIPKTYVIIYRYGSKSSNLCTVGTHGIAPRQTFNQLKCLLRET